MSKLTGVDALIKKDDETNLIYDSPVSRDDRSSASEEVLKEFLSMDNIDTKSRIKPRQILSLAKLFIYEDVFNVPLAGHFANRILRLSISQDGQGRKELTEIVRGLPSQVDAPFDPLSLKNQLFGDK